jgi:hypothetical protein
VYFLLPGTFLISNRARIIIHIIFQKIQGCAQKGRRKKAMEAQDRHNGMATALGHTPCVWLQYFTASVFRPKIFYIYPLVFYCAIDQDGFKKQRNKEPLVLCRRRIGGGATASATPSHLSSVTIASSSLYTMKEEYYTLDTW